MKLRIFSLLAVTALSTTVAMAQPPEGSRPPRGEGRPGGGGPSEGRGRPDGQRPQFFGGGALFRALDADGDGVISAAELANATQALKALDKDGDGRLTAEEVSPPRGEGGGGGFRGFGAGGPGREGRPGGGGGVGMFERLKESDKDGDGKISRQEAPEWLTERFDRFDLNKDGFIDEEEIRQVAERARENFQRGGGGNRPAPGGN